ncbi:MAG: biosynthetic arginine decarboxylase [Planctomycetota bacterium]
MTRLDPAPTTPEAASHSSAETTDGGATETNDAGHEARPGWSIQDATETYGMHAWGAGFVDTTERGTLAVRPTGDGGPAIDLHELVRGLADRGLDTPVLIRFSDITRRRLRDLRQAFDDAIADNGYRGDYRGVYPIKVNQQRQVVEEIRDEAADIGFGLEVGSKPELLAVLGLTAGGEPAARQLPVICNGFKDDEYVETVILAAKLGWRIIPVVEQPGELTRIIEHAEQYGVRPSIGVRAKPTAGGTGRWASSGGNRSKFGLSATGLIDAIDALRQHGMLDCLTLLHFHVGSQINDVRQLTRAIGELAHIYCELVRLGAGLTTIDIGGGLGVDYDGSASPHDGSVNYGLHEYASSVVHRIMAVCDDAGVEHPTIISESGRAMAAYSSVLVMNTVGATRFDAAPDAPAIRAMLDADTESAQPLHDLLETWEAIETRDPTEAYHDALQARDEAMTLFSMGYVSLAQRAATERLFWSIGRRVTERASAESDNGQLPEELATLPELLSDIYYVNFSMFQSMPDHWAIDQVFPIVPIQRLDERPTRLAVLADITCDSDGEIASFICHTRSGPKSRLELHELRPDPSSGRANQHEPYYLAAFLVGAYQEVLGDLHNLFGDTHAVHVSLDEAGRWRLDEVVEGDTVREVLGYVQYNPDRLRRDFRREVERAVHAGTLAASEGRALTRFYEDGLAGYTYLE